MLAALALLTRLPLPRASPGRLEDAAPWFPAVGALLGVLLAGADVLCRWVGFSSAVSSTLVVVLLLVLTGGLHADGLMDTSDAVFGHASAERRLDIMRDPHAGAFGVAALAAVLLLKVVAVDSLPASGRLAGLVAAPVLGRGALILVATLFPTGRPTGLGATVKAGASLRRLPAAMLAPVVVCAALWPVGPVVGVLVAVMAWLVARRLATLLPGLTGDCYGAVCEGAETLVWLLWLPVTRALG